MSNDDWSDREIDSGSAVDREIDRLKRVYSEHAEALSELAASAPTKALARKYRDLIGDINRSILGLEDPGAIVSRSTAERPLERPPVREPERRPRRSSPPLSPASDSPADLKLRTAPGVYAEAGNDPDNALGRIGLILGLAIVVIVLLALFVWKYGGESRSEPPSTKQVTETPTVGVAAEMGEAAPAPAISATPEAQDFGVVYKGTRVVKEFEVFNNTDGDVSIELERSKCRCLWFDYPAVIPAGGKVTLSVAVDGGRVEKGLLSEGVVVSTTGEPRVSTEVQVTAEIR